MRARIYLLFTLIILNTPSYSQTNSFNYQGVIRDTDGNTIANQELVIKISIYDPSDTNFFIEEHFVSSDSYGQINIAVGNGTLLAGDFNTIPWANTSLQLQLDVSTDDGNTFTALGSSPIRSVPLALYALNGNEGPEGPAGNGIESVTDNGDGTITFNFTDGSNYTTPNLAGPAINSEPGNLIYRDTTGWVATDAIKISEDKVAIGSNPALSRLLVKGDSLAGADDPIFEVKNKDGAVVFAVYDNGVEIYIDDSGTKKGVKGGFAVGGITGTKANGNEYLRVTPDSVRINLKEDTKGVKGGFAVGGITGTKARPTSYLKITPDSTRIYVKETTKGVKGGFAVGGITGTKNNTKDLLHVSPDSVRIYIDETNGKGVKGGFAVGGITGTKAFNSEFLRVTSDSTRVYVNNSAKGVKGGFAVGGITGTKGQSETFMDITPYNSLIGYDAGQSLTTGERNAFLGYQAGQNTTEGSNNIFIGNEAGLNTTLGSSNIFVGTASGKNNETGVYNVLIGSNAGESIISGRQNIIIGQNAGYKIDSAWKNVFIGVQAGYENVNGQDNVFIGNFAGNQSITSRNVYIGRTSGMYNTTGEGNVFIGEQSGRFNEEGSGNIFIGKDAGMYEFGSNKLYISNNETYEPLIYGEFDNSKVQINGKLKITNVLNLDPVSSFPGNPEIGDVVYDKNSNSIKFYNGTDWMELQATVSANPPKIISDSIPEKFIYVDSLLFYGTVLEEGGSVISEMGVCYSQLMFFEKDAAEGVNTVIPTTGSFETVVFGLEPNRDYYLRAYAINSNGTALGDAIMITTPGTNDVPTITTSPVVNIGQTEAIGGGNLSKPGAYPVIEMGICWSTSSGPTIDDNSAIVSLDFGEFTANLTSLSSETKYYVRAWASNDNGIAYGNEIEFTTAPSVTTIEDIDGNTYNTIQIGNQTWIKENLRTRKYADGSPIDNIEDIATWESTQSGAYSWYNNDSASYNDPYGLMYNFYAVEDDRGLCPAGWHVATKEDWEEMIDYLGGEDEAAFRIRETGTTHWDYDPGVTNSSGFTAVPGGYRFSGQDFDGIGGYAFFFTSTIFNARPISYYMVSNQNNIVEYGNVKNNGFSVRCIKD
jgi:uncharacterized protein (TIGR02145 family)